MGLEDILCTCTCVCMRVCVCVCACVFMVHAAWPPGLAVMVVEGRDHSWAAAMGLN